MEMLRSLWAKIVYITLLIGSYLKAFLIGVIKAIYILCLLIIEFCWGIIDIPILYFGTWKDILQYKTVDTGLLWYRAFYYKFIHRNPSPQNSQGKGKKKSSSTNSTSTWRILQTKTLELIMYLILTHLFMWFLPVFYVFKKASDLIFASPIPLSLEEKLILLNEEKFGTVLFDGYQHFFNKKRHTKLKFVDTIEVVFGRSLFDRIVLRDSSEACAIGSTIYLERNALVLRPSTLRHEATHCLQFYTHPGGYLGFLSWYFAQYIVLMIYNGFKHSLAYRQIDAEREAYHKERLRQRQIIKANES